MQPAEFCVSLVDAKLKQGPLFRGMNLVAHPCSSGVQLGGCGGCIEVTQIVYFDFITQRAIKDLLETLRQNNGSKHLVAVDYSLQGCLETLHIQIFYVHFC